MDCQAPIIVIGAGRSGTTLLKRILDAHPAISFAGETNFLPARLWLEAWGDRFWYNWARYNETEPASARGTMPEIPIQVIERERSRIGRLIAATLTELLSIGDSPAWGFKEIWNGTSSFKYHWGSYDAVFPRALWVQLIRHPFSFARSCASWNKEDLTLPYLEDRLRDWTTCVVTSRRRATTGNYLEIRYEDVVRDPAGTLSPVLSRAGLEWHPDCINGLKSRHLASSVQSDDGPVLEQADVGRLIDTTPALGSLMAELSYSPPDQFRLDTVMVSDTRRPLLNLSDPNGEQVGDFVPQDILRRRFNERIVTLENQHNQHRAEMTQVIRDLEVVKSEAAQIGLRLDQIEDWLRWSPRRVANALRRRIWSR
jgi:hypothetical protein